MNLRDYLISAACVIACTVVICVGVGRYVLRLLEEA